MLRISEQKIKRTAIIELGQGVNIAREVAAKRLDKQESNLTYEELQKYGPIILFNGGAYDNSLLKEALDKNEITDYPKENFYLFTLPENQTNTGGQFKTLYKEHEEGNIDLNNCEIAIVTNAYHFPRVNRYFDNKPDFDFFFNHNTKPIIFLVDRKFEAPGIYNDLKQELLKLPSYIEKGFVSKKQRTSSTGHFLKSPVLQN